MTSPTTESSTAPETVPAWRLFVGTVGAITPIGHSLIRVTCVGPDFDHFADPGFDQRIKLVLPVEGHGYSTFPSGPDWYSPWRELPEERQNPIRTYTIRKVRPRTDEPGSTGEVDLDLVLHGVNGPASAWAATVAIGDPVALLGPDARYEGDHGGLEFTVPAPGTPVLLAGDETAQPAIAAILEQLPAGTRGRAVLEMPHPDDRLDLVRPAGVALEWLVREPGAVVGSRMHAWFEANADVLFAHPDHSPAPAAAVEAEDPDEEPWDVPAEPVSGEVYAWIAGEAGLVKALRRMLVDDLGVDRSAVAFMGYWRLSAS